MLLILWFSWYLDYKSCKCKKRLVGILVEECTENIEETRLVEITSAELHSTKRKISINAVLACCALFYFQKFSQ